MVTWFINLKQIVGKPSFSDRFKSIIKRYKTVTYNMYIMRQSAYLVVNPITVYSCGFLLNCTTVGHASDSMTALARSFKICVLCLALAGPTVAQLEVFLSSDYW